MKLRVRTAACKSFLLLLCCSILLTRSYSQHLTFGNEKAKVEVGLNFGPTFFLGDLGGHAGYGTKFVKDVNLELTKMMKGVFVTISPNQWMGFRFAAQYTYVAGRDNIINTNGVNELWRKQRNLDFRSNIWEAYGAIEFFPTMYLNRHNEDYDPRFKPYCFAGAGIFHFDPEGSLTDSRGTQTWYKLHPLHTEGEGFAEYPDKKNYSLTQLNIPFGGGVRIELSNRINTSFELLYRKTFTDYIDDVSTTYIDPNLFDRYLSPQDAVIARKIHDKTVGIVTPGVTRYEPGTQRGNSKNMDAYFSFAVKIGFNIGSGRSSEERGIIRQTRCPHYY